MNTLSNSIFIFLSKIRFFYNIFNVYNKVIILILLYKILIFFLKFFVALIFSSILNVTSISSFFKKRLSFTRKSRFVRFLLGRIIYTCFVSYISSVTTNLSIIILADGIVLGALFTCFDYNLENSQKGNSLPKN